MKGCVDKNRMSVRIDRYGGNCTWLQIRPRRKLKMIVKRDGYVGYHD